MVDKTFEGGSAFPHNLCTAEGMTVRDYAAIHIAAGLTADGTIAQIKEVAHKAVLIADALIEELRK